MTDTGTGTELLQYLNTGTSMAILYTCPTSRILWQYLEYVHVYVHHTGLLEYAPEYGHMVHTTMQYCNIDNMAIKLLQ